MLSRSFIRCTAWRSGKGCVFLGLHGFERLDRHHRISTFGRLGRHVRQDCLLFGVECREGGLVQSRVLRLQSCESDAPRSLASGRRLLREDTASRELSGQSRDDSLANKLEKRSYESNWSSGEAQRISSLQPESPSSNAANRAAR